MISNGQKTRSIVPPKSPDELLAMIQFEGTPVSLQDALRALCRELIDIFDTAVRSTPAKVDAMVIEIDRSKWELPQNRLPRRNHSAEKQHAIRTQVEFGVIEESRATGTSGLQAQRRVPTHPRLRQAQRND